MPDSADALTAEAFSIPYSGRVGERDPQIVLDISRLMSRVGFKAPTGVDRVEMAYAQTLLARIPERLSFAGVHPWGPWGPLPFLAVQAFIARTAQAWANAGPKESDGAGLGEQAAVLASLLPVARSARAPRSYRPRVHLQVSPHHLEQTARVRGILRRDRARFVCLVHDLIPIEFPEYATPSSPETHRRRMRTMAELADGVIANSETTRRSLLQHLAKEGRSLPVAVAPLGTEPAAPAPSSAQPRAAQPYFVVIGTIEPRKNHLLLLNLWRRLVETLGPKAAPRLLVIGRRGWENENIIDMLDRCPSLKGVVEEMGHVGDQEMRRLVQGARAVLTPSFAEGFGLPVTEALQAGTPVICSDIAAHRESVDGVADFLDPLDGMGWMAAVLDYATPGSPRRAAQVSRLSRWTAPTWGDHVQLALELIHEVSR